MISIKTAIKFNDDFGNTALIEKVFTSPYKGARRQDAYRLALTADYEDDFLYHVSVHATLDDAVNELHKMSCGTFRKVYANRVYSINGNIDAILMLRRDRKGNAKLLYSVECDHVQMDGKIEIPDGVTVPEYKLWEFFTNQFMHHRFDFDDANIELVSGDYSN